MFTTFASKVTPPSNSSHGSSLSPSTIVVAAPANPTPPPTSTSTSIVSDRKAAPVRPKRSQVARACDWCRVHRVKCDNDQPCNNCRSRGGECSNTGTSQVRTLPHAFREIERLRQRIKELEHEVEKRDQAVAQEEAVKAYASPHSQPTPSSQPPEPAVELNAWGEPGKASRHIEGIFMSTTQHPQKQWFGPSSLFFFIGRMHSYLAVALQQTHSEQSIQIHVANKPFTSSCVPDRCWTRPGDPPAMDPLAYSTRFLSSTQEEYFLDIFWQSHHCSLQIVDEVSFKEHYRSLWTPTGTTRKASALVDIMLALSMQQGMSSSPQRVRTRLSAIRSAQSDPVEDEIELDARWHYQRCQALLLSELECPTISTVQCQIFSVIYLCCSSLQNMAHSSLAVAVRTAHILGLHLEPPHSIPRTERELRKRIWWSLYTVESKTCMKLGRPWSTTLSEATCTIPTDDHELAIQTGCSVSVGGNVTWLTYTVQNTKLVLAARSVYTAFYQKVGLVLCSSQGPSPSLYEDESALETCASFLKESMECLQIWQQNLPDTLKNKRKYLGNPLSTDRSALAIEIFAPVWLQRHRLWLELLYHNLCMNLYRPFISFTRGSPDAAPVSYACAMRCVEHAVALTNITHQVLSETDLLNGWHECFQWQWNAVLTLLGFVLAYPEAEELAAEARAAIDVAVLSFEMFGRDFSVALSAVGVTKDLASKADFISNRSRMAMSDDVMRVASDQVIDGIGGADGQVSLDSNAGLVPMADIQGMLAGTIDMAFLVDGSYDSMGYLYPPSNMNMGDFWMSQG